LEKASEKDQKIKHSEQEEGTSYDSAKYEVYASQLLSFSHSIGKDTRIINY
jgi:hypothetical protein